MAYHTFQSDIQTSYNAIADGSGQTVTAHAAVVVDNTKPKHLVIAALKQLQQKVEASEWPPLT